MQRIAKIGYEKQLLAVVTLANTVAEKSDELNFEKFKENPGDYTIVDIRNTSEFKEGKFFENAINLPLNDLRNSISKIPLDKPIVVHCAGGYRSAAGSSIIAKELPESNVLDLSEKINDFK